MTPAELYQAGQLTEAIAAAGDGLKRKPNDATGRYFLCELLCFAGELERADKQLDLLAEQDSQSAVAAALFRQLIRAEQARQQFFAEGRLPEFLGKPSPILQSHLQASIAFRAGDKAEAGRLIAQAESARRPTSGTGDGRTFSDFRDCDDLCAPVLEVLTSTGKYYWVPVESIVAMELRKPERPRDLLWRQTHMTVLGGPDGEVYLPCIYAGSGAKREDRVRLGLASEWEGAEGEPILGLGLKMFFVGDESRTILELDEIAFDSPVDISSSDGSMPAAGPEGQTHA